MIIPMNVPHVDIQIVLPLLFNFHIKMCSEKTHGSQSLSHASYIHIYNFTRLWNLHIKRRKLHIFYV